MALDAQSAGARVSLSYAQQAHFDIAAALASAIEATRVDPAHALAHARVAELELSSGRLNAALAAAQRAVQIDPELGRTQTMMGFAALVRIDLPAAKAAFERGIALDTADPLPRLGLGLAKMRDGELEAGRAEIEVAVILDPSQSVLRSYLGKAYYEEKRDALAAVQFGLATERDPRDPTPYLYDALRKQALNQPVEALHDLQQSIALNDSRAVYRSRLLLDQDRATRQVSLASIYGQLASEREAVALASASVSEDPSNYSAHRFLSEAYATRDRHDIARTSELLQAQLLQPLSLNPSAPELPFADLSLPGASSRGGLFSSDFISLFERDRVQFQLGGLAGNLGTSGGRALVAGLFGNVSASVGYFEYATDGFRPNSDLSHRIWNSFVQVALSPGLSLQAEYRWRNSSQGDVAMAFDPDYFASRDRSDVEQRSTRLGLTWRPTAASTWIGSAVRSKARFDNRFYFDGFVDGQFVFDDKADAYELQYQGQVMPGGASVVAGIGRSRVDAKTDLHLDYTPLLGVACDITVAPCDTVDRTKVKQWNAYVYAHLKPQPAISATLGLSLDSYDDATVRIRKWNPKLGLRLELDQGLALRAATFGTLKRSLVTQQTIEPTQIVGFNQFYDDVVGTVSRFYVVALDMQPSPATALGIEAGRQTGRTGTGTLGADFAPVPEQKQRTEWLRFDATSRASSSFVAALGLSAERFVWNATIPTDSPTELRTTRLPLTLRSFAPQGYFGEVVTTAVWQRVGRLSTSAAPTGSERFVVVDVALGYRLPARLGTLSLEVKNLFDSRFSYQDDDFRSTESRLSPYLPARRVWLKASLAF